MPPAPPQVLHDANVVHFDVKCDNIQLDPLPGASAADIAAPPNATPLFKVVLVDFGESRDFGAFSRLCAMGHRGSPVAGGN